MNPIFKNLLALIAGLLLGSLVNMCIVLISGYFIPPPADVDTSTMEGLKATMHLFQPKHFLFPFLAHALGTLVGALIAAKFAANHNMKFALAIGLLFFIGGLANVFMLPSPMWFTLVDLTGAYFPMAYLAGRLGRKSN
jgi:hypothetical protein